MARTKVERNISFDSDRKKYYVRLDFGIDPDSGNQIRRTQTFSKLSQARAALRKHESAKDTGQLLRPVDTTLAQWLAYWINDVVTLDHQLTTVYAYKNIINKHVLPALGHIPLQQLTPQHLQRYYTQKVTEGTISSNTVRKHHDLLRVSLEVAVRQGVILTNPASKVNPPKVKRPEIHYYSLEEVQHLFRLAEGTRLEVLIRLAGQLGLRREEIVGLTWARVNFQKRTIEIREVRTSAGKDIIVKEPKTATSVRTLFMPPDVEAVLLREQAKQNERRQILGEAYQDSGHVFTHEDGRPYRPNYASDLFTKFIKDNNLPPLTLHGLRHSFASIANAKGIPMYDIGKALGHSSPATTSKIYTHLLDADHRDMLKKMWTT